MKRLLILLTLPLALCLVAQDKSDVISSNPSVDERLARLEEQAAGLMRSIAELRNELKAPSTNSRPMMKGVRVKTYVRTRGSDPSTPPGNDMTPNDSRVSTASSFDGPGHTQAAGYTMNDAISLFFEGYVKVETAGAHEFLLVADPSYVGLFSIGGYAIVGGHTLSGDGERSVRLNLEPGYHQVQIYGWNKNSRFPNFTPPVLRIKESGRAPRTITPADLWTPDDD